MADISKSIFNSHAAEKLRSPDDLDKYVRVTRSSAWAVISALVLLLAGLLAWGVFGAVSTSVTATGVRVGSEVMCFIPPEGIAKVDPGDAASVGNAQMRGAAVSAVPLSRAEAREKLGNDYLVSALVKGDWAYLVTFERSDGSDLAQGVPLKVDIIIERVAPIKLLLG
ncbi:MAG: hypothetical protein J6D54_01120 [Olsenella sp.]|nr:hypothetical protein [Olsenella sp.]